MPQNVFDRAARDYQKIHDRSLPWGIRSADFIVQRAARVERWIVEHPSRSVAFLDFGCGNGRMLHALMTAPALRPLLAEGRLRLFGLDPSRESILAAKALMPEGVWLAPGWEGLPRGIRFDLVTACHVFHHIPAAARAPAAETLRARMKPEGRLVVWEHNPFNPLTRVLVRACPFDEDARLLALNATCRLFQENGFRSVRHAYVHVFPPSWLAARALQSIEARLAKMPVGAQYWAMFEPVPGAV